MIHDLTSIIYLCSILYTTLLTIKTCSLLVTTTLLLRQYSIIIIQARNNNF